MNYYIQGFNPNVPVRVLIIGCGGTGSFLAEAVARLLTGTKHRIKLMDPDTVETRNTLRQNFYPNEIGQNKAKALAHRISRNFGVPVTYSPHAVTQNPDSPHMLSPFFENSNLVLTCVDNAKARTAVHENFSKSHSAWVLDAGNDNQFGQVLIGNSTDPKTLQNGFSEGHCHRLPMPGLQRPDLLMNQEAPNLDRDCARAIELRDQSPTINQMMATLAADTVLKIITGTCRNMSIYLDLETTSLRSIPASPEETQRVLDQMKTTPSHPRSSP